MSPADIAFHPNPSRFPGQIWSVEIVHTNNLAPDISESLETLCASGLFDAEYYLYTSQEVAEPGLDTLRHYCETGWRQGRRPNVYFYPAWYIETYLDVRDNLDFRELGTDPLL